MVQAVTGSQEDYGSQLGCCSMKLPHICGGGMKNASRTWLAPLFYPRTNHCPHYALYNNVSTCFSILLGLLDRWRWYKWAVLKL